MRGGAISNKPEQTKQAEPEVGVIGPASRPLRAAPRPEATPDGRMEAQLRARVGELEAQLIEVATCLEAAEARTEAARTEIDRAWGVVGDMANSLSWRYTSALRSVLARVRRLR